MSNRAEETDGMLERLFRLRESGTTVRTELRAGLVTFLTMSYIIFVQPAVLSQAGMDFGAVMAATCISAAAATIMMGLFANYPIALAPGMGENFFFAFTVVVGMSVSWRVALGAVFLSGVAFFILSAIRLREMVIEAVPRLLTARYRRGHRHLHYVRRIPAHPDVRVCKGLTWHQGGYARAGGCR